MIGLNELAFIILSGLLIGTSIIISMMILSSNWGTKHQSLSKILIAFTIILFVFFIMIIRMYLVDIEFLLPFSNNATNATIGV